MAQTKRKSSGRRKPPWEKPAPAKTGARKPTKKTLSPGQKRAAKASAKKAGRRYPNLVDNMNAAKTRKPKKA